MAARIDSRGSSRLMEVVVRPTATAGFFVLIAFLWTLLLQRIFAYPFLFLFFGAVMASAWFGGAVAGILSVAFSTLTIAYFFVPPAFSWHIESTSETYFVAFIFCALAVSWVSSAKRRTETSIREANDQLEERVHQRTAELEASNREILERERDLRILTEAIPQQIWRSGSDGSVEYCNHHLLAYTKRSMEQMRGEGFFEVLHPEDADIFRQAWKAAVENGAVFEGEYRIRGEDSQFRWFLIRSLPQKGTNGTVLRWYGTHIDIEDRRRAEQSLAEVRTELSQRSRVMGMSELAASIAHEINQPLTAVVSHAYACREWLSSRPANLEKASSTADKIVQESTRASSVVARVRSLFERESNSREWLDMNRVVQSLLQLMREEALRRDVLLRTELSSNLPRVLGDRVQLQQVLLNLAVNGMDAMTEAGAVRELIIRTGLDGEGQLLVKVEDSGAGIDADNAGRIFDPFFSTKHRGIGIGLSISRSIIEAHDGRLWATPRTAGGTVFQFTIPVRA